MKRLHGVWTLVLAFSLILAACGGNNVNTGNTGNVGNPGNSGNGQGNEPEVQESEATVGDDWLTDITILTGGEAGVYFPLGVAIGNIIDGAFDNVSATGLVSGASVVNLNEISEGQAEMALVQNDLSQYALEGTNMFESVLDGFSGMLTLYPEVIQIVTTADSGIESVGDLIGKRVAVGDAGSGSEANASQILEIHGISYEDISVEYMSFADASTALQDGNIDAAFVTAGTPTGAIQQLATMKDVRILPIEADMISDLISAYPYYTQFDLAADSYDLPEAIITVAVQSMLIVRDDLPEDQVYEMTKAIFDNLQVLQDTHARGHDVTIDSALDGMSIPVHPGAQRFYDEQGS